ncbi:MAG: holo-ACP synthase [Dehalococcoidia bacterium]|nr:holo-ACP synthase [Dehalococcoidia bacterium]
MNTHGPSAGVDIVEIQRIRQAVERWQDAFLRRIYSEAELAYCGEMYCSLAARFAAKEAVVKALGAGGARCLSYREIEILPGENGAPRVKLHGNTLKQAAKLGLREVSISMSHCKEYAVAFSVGHAV